jgi:hypothetical protein
MWEPNLGQSWQTSCMTRRNIAVACIAAALVGIFIFAYAINLTRF